MAATAAHNVLHGVSTPGIKAVCCDVQEYGRQIFKFDLSPADLPVYQTLWRSVAPPDQQEVDAALLLG